MAFGVSTHEASVDPTCTQPKPGLRCLWVTRVAPFPPNYGGDVSYSRRLIESVAATGTSVTVLSHGDDRIAQGQSTSTIWRLVPFLDPGRARSFIGLRPAVVKRFSTNEIRRAFRSLLDAQHWDAVVVDSLAMVGAVLGVNGDAEPRTGKLVYVSHNHETSLRRQLADSWPSWSPTGVALRVDAMRTRGAEERLVASADVITATTSADAERFLDRSPRARTLVLPPGYEGTFARVRTINEQTPRRVLLLGSYAWIAKQLNIRRFLRAAAGPLGAAGIGIDVVGSIPEPFAARLRLDFPTVDIAGPVDDLRPFLKSARMGIVAEEIGGGFKMKSLDYVFNRLPVAAIAGSVEGTPLEAGLSMLEFADHDRLVDGIRRWIDDVEGLDALQEAAFRACKDAFNWEDRGRRLVSELRRPPGGT